MPSFNLDRRAFLLSVAALTACQGQTKTSAPATRKRMAITMDDFSLDFDGGLNPRERNERILEAFAAHNHKAAGFVTGRFVDDPFGDEIVRTWSDAGHLLGNHTYTHNNSSETALTDITADILRNDKLMSAYKGYEKIFRFPFLAEGGEMQKVQAYRTFLKKNGFQNAAVTIDSIDWYTTSRLEARIKQKPEADIGAYRDYYLNAVSEIAEQKHDLATRLGYPDLPHTLLVHHNVLNGFYLKDLMDRLAQDGWSFVDAREAFAHPIYRLEPPIPTRGRSLLSVLAQERGIENSGFPEAYQGFGEKTMDALGL